LTDRDFGDALKNPTTPARGYLLSAVGAAALLLCHTSASAFSLGRMTVQSALGENLRAEIEVTNLSPEEAATLQSAIASGEAFRAAGVDFNPALSGAEATLQRRADGRAVIRITGTRAVSEPFVDLILNFTWSGGRLQRSYTLLIDPRR
jgi:pilus assembly protein FimV